MESNSQQQQQQSEIAQNEETSQQTQQQKQQQEPNFASKVGKYTQGIAMQISKEYKEQRTNVKSYVGQENLGSKIKTDVVTGFKNFFTQMSEGSQFLKEKAQRTKQYFKQDNLKAQLKTDAKETMSSIGSNIKNAYTEIVEGPGGISDTIKKSDQLTEEQYKDPKLRQIVQQDKENHPPQIPFQEQEEKEQQQQQQQQQNLYEQQNYQTKNTQQENEFDYIGGGQEIEQQHQKNDDTDINKLN